MHMNERGIVYIYHIYTELISNIGQRHASNIRERESRDRIGIIYYIILRVYIFHSLKWTPK
jgi:hypothetical protein